jgi:type II restriction/modification system DNA methylase subunit YeeA
MNKAKLKSYAPQARKDFIAAVTARANLLGLSSNAGKLEVAASLPQGDVTVIAGQAWPVKVHSQREQLVTRIQRDGFAQTMEAVAYTWFNRFAALRYMELHDYLGHGHRALSSTEGTLPDILTHAADLAQSGSLPGLKAGEVTEMKLAGNRDGELYRLLLVAQCNALSAAMPFLFERIDDETELLLPDNLLRTDSVIANLVTAIDEEDWKEVEIIGWLYQFYISEKKDEVIGKVVKSEDIPAATQLFTPSWIVQYLVQNSVGRLWLMANPASTLKTHWPYYIEPAQQTPDVQAQLDALIQTRMDEDDGSLNPETITLLDPACGSGHILVEAYEVLKAIYLERGYQPRAIPRLILEKNLYGLDIDDRAAQMAGFALLMKARADDRRLFNEPIKLNVLSLQESKGLDADVLTRALQAVVGRNSRQVEISAATSGFGDDDLFPGPRPQSSLGESIAEDTMGDPTRPAIAALITTFAHSKTFGSLIQIPLALNVQLAALADFLQLALQNGDLYAIAAAQDLMPLVVQAKVLGMQFDAVVANPPYMGNKNLNLQLKIYLKDRFKGFDKDLFSAFMARSLQLGKSSAHLGFMSPFVWMFISSYEELRKHFIDASTITSLIQLEYNASGEVRVPLCVFTLSKNSIVEFTGSFIKLSDFPGQDLQSVKVIEAIRNHTCGWFYNARSSDFQKIPGSPVAFWVSLKVIDIFDVNKSLGELVEARQGLATADNGRFLRRWYEVSCERTVWDASDRAEAKNSKGKWFPYNKGGDFRKWYGNHDYLINWENDGEEIFGFQPKAVVRNPGYYFRESISWSDITSAENAFRYYPPGFIHDSTGHSAFDFKCDRRLILGYCNNNFSSRTTKILNPTLHFHIGYFNKLPYPEKLESYDFGFVDELISIAKTDWDSSEYSWSFDGLPFIKHALKANSLAADWDRYFEENRKSVAYMQLLEEKNNQIFIESYGLEDELSPKVPDSQITLTRADREKDCQRLISYAIGCMMGRYSLDAPGLIYAHAGNLGFDASRYTSFAADADGIVPLTDELWFEDDAVSRIREFLLAVWGADNLTENMAWLAESVGTKASETSDETIRRYLADKFYKDHLQTYKKRPIYWLFSSGKQGAFQALVYLHRYHEGTLARLRAEYVVPLTGKMQSRIDMLQKDAAAASSTAARNKLAKEVEKLKKKHVELLAYDEQLRHHADMRITLHLDDGVKVNYGKFGDLLAEVKAVTGGAGDD